MPVWRQASAVVRGRSTYHPRGKEGDEVVQSVLCTVTHAHCVVFYTCRRVNSLSELQVRLGGILKSDPEPGVVYASVSRMIPHPDYDTIVVTADIALLQLTTHVAYTDTILPICLPSRDVNLDQFKVCVSSGFGKIRYRGW